MPVGKTPPKINELTIKNTILALKGDESFPVLAIDALLVVRL
jgi:hypothetical protein